MSSLSCHDLNFLQTEPMKPADLRDDAAGRPKPRSPKQAELHGTPQKKPQDSKPPSPVKPWSAWQGPMMTNWASPLLQASLVTGKTSARSNAPATAIHARLVAVDLLVHKTPQNPVLRSMFRTKIEPAIP